MLMCMVPAHLRLRSETVAERRSFAKQSHPEGDSNPHTFVGSQRYRFSETLSCGDEAMIAKLESINKGGRLAVTDMTFTEA